MRNSLVAALTACAETRWQPKARRFLSGLSFDELEFIAGFFGACILETTAGNGHSSFPVRTRPSCRTLPDPDLDHKLILVREYLCHSRAIRFWMPVEAVDTTYRIGAGSA